VDAAGHLKQRQIVVSKVDQQWEILSWSKGETGLLWHIVGAGKRARLAEALEFAREWIACWCVGYVCVTSGWSKQAERPSKRSAAGAASPTWWAGVLGVEATATDVEVKSAFRARARETHPDMGGSNEEFIKVYSAWEYVKAERRL
jgi:hypothetical protein